MTATNHLNLLLSDILHAESPSTNRIYHGSLNSTSPLLTFVEKDYHPSITAPLPPRRNASSMKNRRQRQYICPSDKQNSQGTQPLLNSSTLDDLFRALTLECEQYLSASPTSSYQNKTYGEMTVQSSPKIETNVESNDDDYENLHSSNVPLSNGLSPLKTSIEVMSPEKRQIISINISSKKSLSPIVSSSRTYPLLSTTSIISSTNRQSSEEDCVDVSSTGANRKRRRRSRKQPIIPSITRASSSDDERTETINGPINEKKFTVSKRSCSTDYRQKRVQSFYDNHPVSTSSQKPPPSRRTRRRDISLQQHMPMSSKYYENTTPRFPENLCSPLSVLLTSTRLKSDFLDHEQQRRSRLELVNHQPLSLLDRMHQQFYRTSSTNPNNSIPTHRIPSYPVY